MAKDGDLKGALKELNSLIKLNKNNIFLIETKAVYSFLMDIQMNQ